MNSKFDIWICGNNNNRHNDNLNCLLMIGREKNYTYGIKKRLVKWIKSIIGCDYNNVKRK